PRPSTTSETEGPEIKSAGGRIRRRDLRHRQRYGQRHHADERPAHGVRQRTSELEAVSEKQHRTGEDRDDRERDGEIREAAHLAEELLAVSEPLEIARVLADLLLA